MFLSVQMTGNFFPVLKFQILDSDGLFQGSKELPT